LSGNATFLQRLLVGWSRLRSVKLVLFNEKEPTNVCSQRYVASRRPSRILHGSHPWKSAQVQGYFSATTLMLVASD
jgi:hypothetical protein